MTRIKRRVLVLESEALVPTRNAEGRAGARFSRFYRRATVIVPYAVSPPEHLASVERIPDGLTLARINFRPPVRYKGARQYAVVRRIVDAGAVISDDYANPVGGPVAKGKI